MHLRLKAWREKLTRIDEGIIESAFAVELIGVYLLCRLIVPQSLKNPIHLVVVRRLTARVSLLVADYAVLDVLPLHNSASRLAHVDGFDN